MVPTGGPSDTAGPAQGEWLGVQVGDRLHSSVQAELAGGPLIQDAESAPPAVGVTPRGGGGVCGRRQLFFVTRGAGGGGTFWCIKSPHRQLFPRGWCPCHLECPSPPAVEASIYALSLFICEISECVLTRAKAWKSRQRWASLRLASPGQGSSFSSWTCLLVSEAPDGSRNCQALDASAG